MLQMCRLFSRMNHIVHNGISNHAHVKNTVMSITIRWKISDALAFMKAVIVLKLRLNKDSGI